MNWTEAGGKLVRTFRTPDFMTSYRLVSAVVGPSEELNHHPDIAFGWGYVRITLTTHDAGGVTERDHRLAEALDVVLKPFDP